MSTTLRPDTVGVPELPLYPKVHIVVPPYATVYVTTPFVAVIAESVENLILTPAVSHSNNATCIISNSPQTDLDVVKTNETRTVSSVVTFTASPIVPDGVNPTDAVNKSQLDAVVAGTIPASSTTVYGSVRMASSQIKTIGTATMTIASPCVVTFTSHGLIANDIIYFTTTSALPTGITANTIYYIISAGLTANEFQFSITKEGAPVATSSTGTDVSLLWESFFQTKLEGIIGGTAYGLSGMQLKSTTAQTIPASWTKVLATAEIDTGLRGGDLANSRYVVPIEGKYLIHFEITGSSPTVSGATIAPAIYVDGASALVGGSASNHAINAPISASVISVLTLDAGAVIEFYALSNAADFTVNIGNGDTIFSVVRIP